jgi:hypothetical protein
MKTKRNFIGLTIFAALLYISQALHAQQDTHVTTQKFIAYSLYNFSKLIDWPNSASATSFRIVIVGDKTVYDELLTLSKNRKVFNASYDICFCKKFEELEGTCQIIYLSNLYSGKVQDLDQNPSLKNALLVTERQGMASYGSVISFTTTDKGTMGFEIAKENAKKKQLSIRSQLERMAVAVL